jgi:hypothetical protein
MKTSILSFVFALLSSMTFAQQATQIDPKSLILPQYANLTAINASIPSPTQGMMVYNISTASNWYYNGSSWVNTATLILPYSQTQALALGNLFSISNTATVTTANTVSAIKGEYNGAITNSFGIGTGVYGKGVKTSGSGEVFGVYGETISDIGVAGKASGSGIGVSGVSETGYGVIGNSTYGTGGYFLSFSSSPALKTYATVGTSIEAISSSSSSIEATNASSVNPTIKIINNTNLGPALDLTGGLKVSGANKTAFKIVTGAPYIAANKFGIVNTTMANASTDILIVTYQYTGGTYLNKQFATFWNDSNWEIHLTDGSAMPSGIAFNVLVIKQ